MKDKRLSAIARLAGTSYLLSTVIVVYANLGIVRKLIAFNNMAETTKNITGQENLFRFTIVLNLFYCIGTIINLSAIYALLKPFSNTLSLIAASLKLVMPFTWIFIAVNSYVVLRLINVPVYSQAFNRTSSTPW